MLEITLLNLVFFLAGAGSTTIAGAILLAARDIRRLSTSDPTPDGREQPQAMPEPVLEPEQPPVPEPVAVPTPALVLTTGLYPALADLHEPQPPQLPMHEWWMEQTAPYQLVDEPPREPIPDPDVLTGRMRWGGTRPALTVVRPNGVDLMSPLPPGDAALRVCDLVLAGAA